MSDYYESDGDAYGYSDEDPYSDGSSDPEEAQDCAGSEDSEEAQDCAGYEESEEAQYCTCSEESDGCEDYESSDIEDINYGTSYKSQSMGNQFGNYQGSSSGSYKDKQMSRCDYPDRSQVQVTAPREGRCDYPDRSQVQVTAPRQGLQRGSQEWSFKQSHVERDKQSGGYARLTTKDEISTGKIFKERSTGRDGFKNELKSTTTYRVGDKRGYSEYQIEERHRRVEFGGTPSNKDNRYGPTNHKVRGTPSYKNTKLK